MINMSYTICVRKIKTSWNFIFKRYILYKDFIVSIEYMKLSVVIPTRWDQNMKNSIACLQNQTFTDFEIVFVIDRNLKEVGTFVSHDNIRYITNLNSSFRTQRDDKEPMIGGNASTLRNYWINAAQWEFILLMDDDEWFEDNYLEQYMDFWAEYKLITKRDFVLTPTLMYRKTWQIQNQWFSHFSYLFSRPIPQILWNKAWDYIQMYSWNSLLAPAHIFKEVLFDETLDFVYEDLDFSYRIHRAGYPIIVLRDLKIYHMERDKNKLEEARVGNQHAAYRKAKHRMLFVKKYGTLTDKIKFYLLGFWWQPLRLIIKILRFAPWKQKWNLVKAIWKGTFYHYFSKKKNR